MTEAVIKCLQRLAADLPSIAHLWNIKDPGEIVSVSPPPWAIGIVAADKFTR